jgi:hypothetical protein
MIPPPEELKGSSQASFTGSPIFTAWQEEFVSDVATEDRHLL